MSLVTDVVSVEFSTQTPNLTEESMVCVNLGRAYNRKPLPEAHEKQIDILWNKKLVENPNLFNGTKFRLDSMYYSKQTDLLTLNVGLTSYKEFQGTNWSPQGLELQSLGLQDHDNSQAYISDAIGVGAMVKTIDDHMVLLFRTKICGEDQELWDRPGGHAEPKELVGDLDMESIDLEALTSGDVVGEIFNSITREVVDEVNIPESALEKPRILGIFRSTMNSGKPNIEFLIRCSLRAEDVVKLYKQGNQAELFESNNIKVLHIEDAINARRDNPELWKSLAPGARGTIILYSMYKHRFLS